MSLNIKRIVREISEKPVGKAIRQKRKRSKFETVQNFERWIYLIGRTKRIKWNCQKRIQKMGKDWEIWKTRKRDQINSMSRKRKNHSYKFQIQN